MPITDVSFTKRRASFLSALTSGKFWRWDSTFQTTALLSEPAFEFNELGRIFMHAAPNDSFAQNFRFVLARSRGNHRFGGCLPGAAKAAVEMPMLFAAKIRPFVRKLLGLVIPSS